MDINFYPSFYKIRSVKYVNDFKNGKITEKQMALKSIILNNYMCHITVEKMFNENANLLILRRCQRKAKTEGVRIMTLDKQIKELEKSVKELKMVLFSMAHIMTKMLDVWQEQGATYEDLCSLFNYKPCDIAEIEEAISEKNVLFSAIALSIDNDEHRGYMFRRYLSEIIKECRASGSDMSGILELLD